MKGGTFIVIRLRGGDVDRGISDRDRMRIDRWLASPGFQSLVQQAVDRAWQRAGQYIVGGLVTNLSRLSAGAFRITATVVRG